MKVRLASMWVFDPPVRNVTRMANASVPNETEPFVYRFQVEKITHEDKSGRGEPVQEWRPKWRPRQKFSQRLLR